MTSKPDLGILLAGHRVHGPVAEAIGDCVVEVGAGAVAARFLIVALNNSVPARGRMGLFNTP